MMMTINASIFTSASHCIIFMRDTLGLHTSMASWSFLSIVILSQTFIFCKFSWLLVWCVLLSMHHWKIVTCEISTYLTTVIIILNFIMSTSDHGIIVVLILLMPVISLWYWWMELLFINFVIVVLCVALFLYHGTSASSSYIAGRPISASNCWSTVVIRVFANRLLSEMEGFTLSKQVFKQDCRSHIHRGFTIWRNITHIPIKVADTAIYFLLEDHLFIYRNVSFWTSFWEIVDTADIKAWVPSMMTCCSTCCVTPLI